VIRSRRICPRYGYDILLHSLKVFLCLTATLLGLMLSMPGMARDAVPVGADPVIHARMMKLASVLRCLMCQNQTIADSHAPLAEDLRNQITEQMQHGKTDDEIMAYMVARYGDFVLYRPPLKATTVLLWVGPGLLVLLGIGLVVRTARRSAAVMANAPQSDRDAIQAVEHLLTSDEEGAV
jgi:cytochrome c-type biogenesis protein CcmH